MYNDAEHELDKDHKSRIGLLHKYQRDAVWDVDEVLSPRISVEEYGRFAVDLLYRRGEAQLFVDAWADQPGGGEATDGTRMRVTAFESHRTDGADAKDLKYGPWLC